ncbi:hypothetical protein HMPREF3151_01430 [Corynebacterium sp. HMSC05H05]|uniref:TetR/AcrR family transcriptional regulator n=1 Tax=Corynebacterium sp. HMSC05H05 TaxID=1581119 RepID=UPI0008A49BAE|nr:TetR/AcrR family transcriptional regulator [Corynebacterium sp. HMSC05H05]OFT59311.1 hypothetical protein HMPREF3151_01430 [Corynebacterium sp. HMSC05H05]
MQNEGIREQKRRETLQRIRDEAAKLVRAHGYDNVTVDDICHDAGISRRTFFNYVDSKDEAILGSFPFAFSEDALAAIRETPSENVLELVIRSVEVQPGRFDGPAAKCRRELLENNPGLMHAEATRKRGFLTEVGRAVYEHLERFPDDRRHTGTLESETQFIVVLFQGAVSRYLWHPPEGADPVEQLLTNAHDLSTYAKEMTW